MRLAALVALLLASATIADAQLFRSRTVVRSAPSGCYTDASGNVVCPTRTRSVYRAPRTVVRSRYVASPVVTSSSGSYGGYNAAPAYSSGSYGGVTGRPVATAPQSVAAASAEAPCPDASELSEKVDSLAEKVAGLEAQVRELRLLRSVQPAKSEPGVEPTPVVLRPLAPWKRKATAVRDADGVLVAEI